MVCAVCPPDPVAHQVLAFPGGAVTYKLPDYARRDARRFVAAGDRLVVLARHRSFVRVRVTTGSGPTYLRWVRARDGSPVRTSYSLVIRRRMHEVLVFRQGRRVERIPAGVGTSSTPTPRGLYTISRRIRLTAANGGEFQTYGCCVMALDITARAPFGNQVWGTVALHRNFGGDLGRAVSHGCVRLPLDRVRWLYTHLPAGTLVRIE
jgi:hypothetical protein